MTLYNINGNAVKECAWNLFEVTLSPLKMLQKG